MHVGSRVEESEPRSTPATLRDAVRSVVPSAVNSLDSGFGRECARCGMRVRIQINLLYYCIRVGADHSPLASIHCPVDDCSSRRMQCHLKA